MAVVRNAGKADPFVIIRDTREKKGHGWQFRSSSNCGGMEIIKLDVGDYTIKGLENLIMVERKSLGDLWGTLGNPNNYKRFLREMNRAKKHPYKFLVIEATLADLDRGYSWSKVPSNNIHGKLVSLQIKHNLHVIFAGRQDRARQYVRRLLVKMNAYYKEGLLENAAT